MSSTLENDNRLADIRFTDRDMTLVFRDGRQMTAPLWKYPRLLHATAQARNTWRVMGPDRGIHWPDLDEDLTIAGILEGRTAAGAVPPARTPEPVD